MRPYAALLPLALFVIAACSSGTTGDDRAVGWNAIAAELRSAGETLQDAGRVEQPFWTGRAHVYTTSDAELQVFEFPSEEAAAAAAAEVSPQGGSIGTTAMSWMQPPHFFRRDSLIVIYVGSNESTLQRLRNVFGTQFAGQ